jgi:hypothetical protein
MIALLASALLGLYILIPDLLFRRVTSWFTPLKKFQRTKIEEVVFGIFVAALPICATWILSTSFWFVGHHPFALDEGKEARMADYRTLILAADSDSYFKENADKVWTAVAHIEKRQLRFLTWASLMLFLEIGIWIFLTYNYARFRRFKSYNWFANKILLKRLSEWHMLLSTYNFPKNENRYVLVDAMSDGHLYQGSLAEKFLDIDGNLSGILLKDARRYKFAEHEEDRKNNKLKTGSDAYWSTIKSGNLYISFAKISNLNIHYKLPKKVEQKQLQDVAVTLDDLKKILERAGKSIASIKIETRETNGPE